MSFSKATQAIIVQSGVPESVAASDDFHRVAIQVLRRTLDVELSDYPGAGSDGVAWLRERGGLYALVQNSIEYIDSSEFKLYLELISPQIVSTVQERARRGPKAKVTGYRVKYYDRKLSHKGRGTQVRVFTDYDEAKAFAARNKIYGKPCRVEEGEL